MRKKNGRKPRAGGGGGVVRKKVTMEGRWRGRRRGERGRWRGEEVREGKETEGGKKKIKQRWGGGGRGRLSGGSKGEKEKCERVASE